MTILLAFLLALPNADLSERVLKAIRDALVEGGRSNESVQIEVVSVSPADLSASEVKFSWANFPKAQFATPKSVLLWPGNAVGQDGKIRPIWARVRLWQQQPQPVASRAIRAGEILAGTDVRIEPVAATLSTSPQPGSALDWQGRTVLRAIPAGAVVTAAHLGTRRDIAKGDTVRVSVHAGAAKLTLEARADTPGQAGETIICVNPTSGKRFRAVVSGAGSAVLRIE